MISVDRHSVTWYWCWTRLISAVAILYNNLGKDTFCICSQVIMLLHTSGVLGFLPECPWSSGTDDTEPASLISPAPRPARRRRPTSARFYSWGDPKAITGSRSAGLHRATKCLWAERLDWPAARSHGVPRCDELMAPASFGYVYLVRNFIKQSSVLIGTSAFQTRL
jgi:hypothetical protein